YQGEIQHTGAPAELRARLRAKRLELSTPNLGEAERLLSKVSGPDKEIIDVQRFGDRLDLLAHDPEEGQRILKERMSEAGLSVDEIRSDEPTLENTFVATWRGRGKEAPKPRFPGRHDQKDLRGQVAIGASGLTMQFGSFTAVNNVSVQVRYGEIYG